MKNKSTILIVSIACIIVLSLNWQAATAEDFNAFKDYDYRVLNKVEEQISILENQLSTNSSQIISNSVETKLKYIYQKASFTEKRLIEIEYILESEKIDEELDYSFELISKWFGETLIPFYPIIAFFEPIVEKPKYANVKMEPNPELKAETERYVKQLQDLANLIEKYRLKNTAGEITQSEYLHKQAYFKHLQENYFDYHQHKIRDIVTQSQPEKPEDMGFRNKFKHQSLSLIEVAEIRIKGFFQHLINDEIHEIKLIYLSSVASSLPIIGIVIGGVSFAHGVLLYAKSWITTKVFRGLQWLGWSVYNSYRQIKWQVQHIHEHKNESGHAIHFKSKLNHPYATSYLPPQIIKWSPLDRVIRFAYMYRRFASQMKQLATWPILLTFGALASIGVAAESIGVGAEAEAVNAAEAAEASIIAESTMEMAESTMAAERLSFRESEVETISENFTYTNYYD